MVDGDPASERTALEPVLTVLGELVVDLLPDPGTEPESTAPRYVARPGGNALNVAVAAGRLGAPVSLLGRLGTGPMAAALRRHAELAGVDVGRLVAAGEPISLAVVGLDATGSPHYGFHVAGAADWQWTDDELGAALPDATAILHVGSISSWTAPGGDAIARLVERVAGRVLISVDPNIRPPLVDGPIGTLLGNDADGVRTRLRRLLAAADIVKVSAEDLAWLDPTAELDDVARTWADRGPALVLVTDGGRPLRVARPGRALLRREIPEVRLVDTVGAGDTLAAALFAGLLRTGRHTRSALGDVPDDKLLALVDEAALAAALNCTRVGADPPTRAELDAARRPD